MDWWIERSVGIGMNGVTLVKQNSFANLYFTDDICLLAELLDLLVPALEAFTTEAAVKLQSIVLHILMSKIFAIT